MGRLTAIVLGSAAGGGFPQWNCNCPVCRLAWGGDTRVRARTQASLAVSADRHQWILLNASPDLRAQLNATPALHPGDAVLSGVRSDAKPVPTFADRALRSSPIAAVVLTGAEIDQVAGLLNLRESQAFAVYATAPTLAALDDNPMFAALAPDVVARRAVAFDAPFAVGGVEVEFFAVPGKVPLYLEGGAGAAESGVNAGIEIRAAGARLLYVPGAAAVTPAMMARFAAADIVLFDGTLYADDEMIRLGVGTKTGRRMGHMPIDGADGSLAALAQTPARRVYIHINNTNPILVEGSPERNRVAAAGWQVAEDGMEIVL